MLIVEKKRKSTRKEATVYDDVPHPTDDNSTKGVTELNQEIYENMHVHTNAGFVNELNDIIKKNAQTTAKPPNVSHNVNKSPNVPSNGECSSNLVGKTESIEANMDITETCDEETYYEESEPIKPLARRTLETHPKARDNIYINHETATPNCDHNDIKEETPEDIVSKQNSSQNDVKPSSSRYSPQIDLEKAQEIYENAAFPVKYSRIATPRICERSRQGSKKGKPPIRKGYEEAEPVLQKLERPKIAVRRNPSAVSDNELIYDDVPDETAEDEAMATKTNGIAKPPIKPKPRLSKIMKNKNKTPSPKMKTVDDTMMIDNEVYTGTS